MHTETNGKGGCMAQGVSSTALLIYLLVAFSPKLVLASGPEGTQNSVWLFPQALQLPRNWYFKPAAAKTCSHDMFMKCQMLQSAIVTVPRTFTSIPNCANIVSPPPFSNTGSSSNSQPPCPATTLLPFSRDLPFLWAPSPVQLSHNHHLPTRPLDSSPHHLPVPDLLVQRVLMFSRWLQVCCYFIS